MGHLDHPFHFDSSGRSASTDQLGHVRDLIESAVTSGTDWRTIAIGHDTLTEEETILSQRLRGEQ